MRKKRPANQPTLFESRAADINRWAARLAEALRQASTHAQTEEDIRVAVERQLERIQDDLKIELVGRQEYTLLKGRVDSVYGRVLIEYKNPSDSASRLGPALSVPGSARVAKQLEERFKALPLASGGPVGDVLGVGCDGKYFIFARLVAGKVEIDSPVEVSQWSCRRFLWGLFNLGERGLGLTPAALARDFGADGGLAGHGVVAFANSLRRNAEVPRVKTFLRQWLILFGEVCGYDVERPTGKIAALADHYQLAGFAPAEILFSLHTYYALLMKLLAAHVVNFSWKLSGASLNSLRDAPSANELRRRLRELEDGGVFRHLSVFNFLEGDLFSWYLEAWTEEIEAAVREMSATLLRYNPGTMKDNPVAARDLLKGLYHELFPRSVRHDLGEYYTPDWLAELTLDEAGYDGNPRTRVLDPACGSGTFLVLALVRVRQWMERNFEQAPPPDEVAQLAARNIIGFDLNPLAVLAARTNYLIQIIDLFEYYGEIRLPVFLCDSVLTPAEHGETEEATMTEKPVGIPTSAAMFLVPREVTRDSENLAGYCDLLGSYARVGSGHSVDDFLRACKDKLIPVTSEVEHQHRDLFDQVRRLDQDKRNGVWARFIRNAFAPVFLRNEKVDLVVGNPPWVNWENLPGRMDARSDGTYRQRIAKVFERYGLFSLSGGEGRLGGGKKDLSMLFAYACIDHYLNMGGKLVFVIIQTLFKSKGAGDGFRRFEFGDLTGRRGRPPRVCLNVRRALDLSAFQPFEGATNRTAIFVCEKSRKPTKYPVPYQVWAKINRGKISPGSPLEEVRSQTQREDLEAFPVTPKVRTSPWLTAPAAVLRGVRRVIGEAAYEAHAGSFTGGLNGCFWMRTVRRVPAGILIENLHDTGKIKVERVQCAIEPDLVFPLLRGRDVRKWHTASSAEILLAQDPDKRRGIPEQTMRREYPLTWSYLKRFEALLRNRSSSSVRRLMDAGPFYSMFAVGPYTMGCYKVVWREQSGSFQAAVVGPAADNRRVIPDHKLMLVDCGNRPTEAHYLCALLNSAPVVALVDAYVISTSTSTHVLDNVGIPRFDPDSNLHASLAAFSQQAHQACDEHRADDVQAIERRIDEAAGRLWRIGKTDLQAISRHVRALPPRPLLDREG